MSGDISRLTVVGAGAWGTALAIVALRAGRAVTLLAREPQTAAAIARERRNPRLPEVELPPELELATDPARLAEADAVLLAVPAQAIGAAAAALAPNLRGRVPVIVTAKGIERGTGRFMTEVVAEALPAAPVAILSGPSFAADVAAGLPTAVTLAARDAPLARRLAEALASPQFRPYHTTDVRGVEIGGAAKNVLAIACGVARGRGLGASAGAALVARGFAELSRLAQRLGARPETLMGLSGLGDLVLTATTPQSRNFAFGAALGRGVAVAEALAAGLAEGAFTAEVLVTLAGRHGVEMPISAAVADLVAGRLDVEEAMRRLLERPLRGEGP